MYHNIDFKDLEAISKSIDICSIGDFYNVTALTNTLEGNINALVKITSKQDATLGRNALFSFRSGEQVCVSSLSQDEQLIIPDEDFARLKKSLSIKLEFLGDTKSIWEKTIDKLNESHVNDSNSNYQVIPTDLPIPEFKHLPKEEKKEDTSSNDTPIKPSFFKRLFGRKAKNNQ